MTDLWCLAAAALAALCMALLVLRRYLRLRTVRIYNWNGRRYCYLGRGRVRRDGGGYRVRLTERLADLSYTTLYRICPSREFVRRHLYADLAVLAGAEQRLLAVEPHMQLSVYYRREWSGL